MSAPDETWSLEETLVHIMKSLNCNRRRARKELERALRAGKLAAFRPHPGTGELVEIDNNSLKNATVVDYN